MVIELIADSGERMRITRGWVILTLALASWGLMAVVGYAFWGLLHLFG